MKTFKVNLSIFSLFFLLLAGANLHGQPSQSASQTITNTKLAQETAELNEIWLTPYRYNVDPWRVGASVEVITRQDIERLGSPPVREILNTLPGLRTTANGVFSTSQSLFVRGLASAGSKIFIDGIEQSYGAFSSTLFYLNTEEIERIEVIKGGAATFYGADVFGGVVNIITKKTDAKPFGVDFDFEGGSFATLKTSLRFHGYIKGFSYSLFGLGQYSDGLSRAKNTNSSTNAAFDEDRFENNDISLRLAYEQKNYQLWLKTRYQSVFNEYDSGAFVDGPQHVREEHVYQDVHWSHDIGKIYQYILAYNFHQSDITNHDFFSPQEIAYRHAGLFQNNLVFPWFRSGVGVDFFTEELEITNTSASNYKAGVYAEVARDVGKYFNFSAGLRYDIYQDYDNQLSYRASAAGTYEDFKLNASYGRSVVSPTLSQRQFASNLSQQIGDHVDVGFTYWNKKLNLKANVTYFINDVKDEIGWNRLIGTFGGFVNADYQAQGIEASFQQNVLSWLALGVNYTYTTADSPYTNHQAVSRPEHQGNLNLNISPLSAMNINLNLAYVGETYSFLDKRISSYYKLDLNFSYQVTDKFTPYVRLENVLNQDYVTSEGYNEPGFSAYGGLRFRY